jgi:hypothetical protein
MCSFALAGAAQAARLDIANVSASSTYPAEKGVVYDAKQAKDGKVGSSWVEGDKGSGLGSWIEVDLGTSQDVKMIRLWGGLWYSYDLWTRANRPKSVELTFSDGSTELHELTDEMVAQTLTLKKPRKTKTVRVKVKEVYKGTTWFDTAISEIQVFDGQKDSYAAVGSYGVSSVLPEDADGNYKPENMNDGIGDSMWCEGNSEGDGVGEWIEFNFPGPQKVGKLTLVNGIGSSLGGWMKGNRASQARLNFSDGSSEVVEIKNSFRPQVISFSPRTATGVKLTFTKIMKGKEYNDLCLSEAVFSQ